MYSHIYVYTYIYICIYIYIYRERCIHTQYNIRYTVYCIGAPAAAQVEDGHAVLDLRALDVLLQGAEDESTEHVDNIVELLNTPEH